MNDDQTPKGTDEINPEIKTEEQPKPEPTAEELLRQENEELKKKFGASTTENQILQTRLAAEEEAREKLTKEPTDSELRTAFPSWDAYSDSEKELARRTFGAERSAANASRLSQAIQDDRAWQTSISLVTASDPALQGKEQAFTQYASKSQHKGVPMDILVAAFLQLHGGAIAPKTTPKPGLEIGNGGPRVEPKPKGLTAEQLTALRTSDYKAYVDYISTHDIELED